MKAIGTWKMAYDALLSNLDYKNIDDFLINCIKYVESSKDVHAVGNYSFPNSLGFLELDAAYMNGDDLMFGSVMALSNHIHPIEVAYLLSKFQYNNVLVGNGADLFAEQSHLKLIDPIPFESYDNHSNHDTCAFIAQNDKTIKLAISSSGRNNKHPGRVGDSPLIGSGFYCNSELAGICFTGDGEVISRGVLAKSVIDDYKYTNDLQLSMTKVCDEYLHHIRNQYIDIPSFCAIGIDLKGNFATYTSIDDFPFAILENNEVKLMYSKRINGNIKVQEVDDNFLKYYKGD